MKAVIVHVQKKMANGSNKKYQFGVSFADSSLLVDDEELKKVAEFVVEKAVAGGILRGSVTEKIRIEVVTTKKEQNNYRLSFQASTGTAFCDLNYSSAQSEKGSGSGDDSVAAENTICSNLNDYPEIESDLLTFHREKEKEQHKQAEAQQAANHFLSRQSSGFKCVTNLEFPTNKISNNLTEDEIRKQLDRMLDEIFISKESKMADLFSSEKVKINQGKAEIEKLKRDLSKITNSSLKSEMESVGEFEDNIKKSIGLTPEIETRINKEIDTLSEEIKKTKEGMGSEMIKYKELEKELLDSSKKTLNEVYSYDGIYIVQFAKKMVATALYNAGIDYCNDIFLNFTDENKRKDKLKELNDSFGGIISIGTDGQIQGVNQIYTLFEQSSLAEIANIIGGLLKKCDTSLFGSSEKLKKITAQLTKVEDECKKKYKEISPNFFSLLAKPEIVFEWDKKEFEWKDFLFAMEKNDIEKRANGVEQLKKSWENLAAKTGESEKRVVEFQGKVTQLQEKANELQLKIKTIKEAGEKEIAMANAREKQIENTDITVTPLLSPREEKLKPKLPIDYRTLVHCIKIYMQVHEWRRSYGLFTKKYGKNTLRGEAVKFQTKQSLNEPGVLSYIQTKVPKYVGEQWNKLLVNQNTDILPEDDAKKLFDSLKQCADDALLKNVWTRSKDTKAYYKAFSDERQLVDHIKKDVTKYYQSIGSVPAAVSRLFGINFSTEESTAVKHDRSRKVTSK